MSFSRRSRTTEFTLPGKCGGVPALGHAQPLRELLSSDWADSGTGILSAGRAAPSQTSVACSDGLDVSDFISASRRSYRAMVRWKARVARRRR